jgi:hypothetical protein
MYALARSLLDFDQKMLFIRAVTPTHQTFCTKIEIATLTDVAVERPGCDEFGTAVTDELVNG